LSFSKANQYYASSESFIRHQDPVFIIRTFETAAQIAKIYGQPEIYCQHLISIGNAYADGAIAPKAAGAGAAAVDARGADST
jgi:hypothetical protein